MKRLICLTLFLSMLSACAVQHTPEDPIARTTKAVAIAAKATRAAAETTLMLKTSGVLKTEECKLIADYLEAADHAYLVALSAPTDSEAVKAAFGAVVQSPALQSWLATHQGDKRVVSVISTLTAVNIAVQAVLGVVHG